MEGEEAPATTDDSHLAFFEYVHFDEFAMTFDGTIMLPAPEGEEHEHGVA